MFREILVGVDGGDGGRDALALARVLAEATEARVTLAHAYPFDVLPNRTTNRTFEGYLRQDAQEMLERERDAAGLAGARLVPVGDVHPARALHHVAQQDHTDLLVVGATHHHGMSRAVLGDQAANTIHGSPCAVGVAPAGYRDHPRPPALIGVGYDGSPEARDAVRFAGELSVAARAKLRVLTAFDDRIPLFAPYPTAYQMMIETDDFFAERREQVGRALNGVVADTPGDVEGRIVDGTAEHALETASEELDVLVAGSRDYGPIRRVLLGSTSRRLVQRVRCPLVVLPRSAHRDEAATESAAPVNA